MFGRVSAAFVVTLGIGGSAVAATTNVTTPAELRTAFAAAQAGTTIHLAAGAYALDAPLTTMAAGTVAQPIKLTSDKADGVRLDFSSTDGLIIAHAYWVIDGVSLNGTCSGCEAAGLRVQPTADHLTVHSSRFTNFAVGIKGDRAGDAEPSDNVIDTNEFYNAPRLTGGGTPVALVGGKRWHIIGNYIHDFTGTGKHPGISVSGGASDALIERNLIVGDKDRPAGGMSLGLSLGAEDTPPTTCAAANRGATSCTCEVVTGLVHNNIIVRTAGHGVLFSRACGAAVLLNTAYLTVPGVEIVTPGPTGNLDVRFNVMSGTMAGTMATVNKASVSAAAFKSCYKDPDNLDFSTGPNDQLINDLQTAITEVKDDYLGDMRNGTLDYGAVELKAGTRPTWPWAGTALIGNGMAPPGGGAVSPAPDAGSSAMDAAAAPDGGGADGSPDAAAAPDGGGAAGAGGSPPGGSGGGGSGGNVPTGGAGGQAGSGIGGSQGGAATGSSSGGGCACAVATGPSRSRADAALLLFGVPVGLCLLRRRRCTRR